MTATTPVVVDTSCAAFKQLSYSTKNDSPETVEGIKAQNRVYRKLCP